MSLAGVPNPLGALASGVTGGMAGGMAGGLANGGKPTAPATPVEVLSGYVGGGDATQIDALMERASAALLRMDYFETIELSLRALDRARRKRDWERVARITMPLQEARRQVRQLATDAHQVFVLRSLPSRGQPLDAGLYLLEPPMIGLDGATLRDMLRARKISALVLVKEPTTSAGKWPIVGVGRGEFENVVARVQLDPPASLAGHTGPLANAPADALQAGLADGTWFQSAQEALGDAAIRKVRPEWPAAHRVDDLAEYLDAVPDHEKLSQALEATAREAMTAPIPAQTRRRPFVDNPYGI
jgi:hypothetical protein